MGEQPDAASSSRERTDQEHVAELPDGCGCAEVWEYLSSRRTETEDG